jgi:Family of unknown function (DUF6056)
VTSTTPARASADPPARGWAGALAWALVLVPWALVLVICLRWEPVLRDSWNYVLWYRAGGELTVASLWDHAWGMYLGGNPRLGQVATFALLSPSNLHVWVTPMVVLGTFGLLTALVLGRWPRLRHADDAWVFAAVAAMILLVVPQVGPMFCYRPFVGNYVYGFFFHLALYLPYRLFAAAPRRYPRWLTPVMLMGAVAAGLTNEHTGPASLLLLAAAMAWFHRRGDRTAAWMWAGLVGLALGYVALYLAPGHAFRYGGVATQQGLLERVLSRPAGESWRVVRTFLVPAACTFPWWALAFWVRRRSPGADAPSERRVAVAAFAAGCAMAITLLGSPKYGPRLYFAPVSLAVVAALIWARPAFAQRTPRALLLAGSLAISSWGFARLVSTYHRAHGEFAQRMALLTHATAGTRVLVPPYSLPASRWFLGEDLVAPELRATIAAELHLDGIDLGPSP